MITKKIYIKAAQIVNDLQTEARDTNRVIGDSQRLFEENVATEVAGAFVKLFEGDNPSFNKERFLEACKT